MENLKQAFAFSAERVAARIHVSRTAREALRESRSAWKKAAWAKLDRQSRRAWYAAILDAHRENVSLFNHFRF